MTRRKFVASATGAAVLVMLPGCSTASGISSQDRRALLRLARLIYPHDALADEVYLDSLRPLLVSADSEHAIESNLHDGFRSLDVLARGQWIDLSPGQQVVAVERIEDGPFFGLVQREVRANLYQDARVWDLIGYEGSSVEHGGYLHRGFDDIDWLPEA